MNQEPGSNSPREYGPPTIPPPTIPGAVGAPGDYPRRRRGMPWWGWLLSGCGGCAVLVVVALIVVTVLGVNAFQGAMKEAGPVNSQAIQQGLGEVPLYPSLTINEPGTRIAMGVIRATEKANGKERGSILKVLAVGTTPDTPGKVHDFYAKKLPPMGWKEAKTTTTGLTDQHIFLKGNESFVLQVQPQAAGSTVTVMRGAADLATQTRREMNR